MASRLTNTTDYQKIYLDFCTEYDNQLITNKKSLPFNFNILDAQCGTIKENSHTNILMKLLEYKNQYGYVFLEDFIKLANFNFQIEGGKPVIFKTEYFGAVPDEKKAHKKKQGRIDGLIYQERTFAIIIENKINGAPPQDRQLERYIESVIGKGDNNNKLVDAKNVYVVFLTKDGVEHPDNESITYMRGEQLGILNKSEPTEESEPISGPRYFACSYRFDILPWLENNVQPQVIQKEMILNTGLVQYIDFLKGMLGERDVKNAIWENCKKWFDENQTIQTALNGNLQEQNSFLYDFYKYLKDLDVDNSATTDEEKKKQTDCINLLQSIVCEKAEEPMAEFMRVTKEFFTTGDDPLILDNDYIVSHPSNFAYINIRSRDKKWPKGFKIGWYPARFFKDAPEASLFYQIPSDNRSINGLDEDMGFKYYANGKAWRKEYSSCQLPSLKDFDGNKLIELYKESRIKEVIELIVNS